MSAAFRMELLAGQDRTGFRCGQEALDRYFQAQATQDMRRHVANCFVAVEVATGRVAGYYTLAAAGIPVTELPPEITKKLPRYPSIPAVRLGRLAVDESFRGRGLGAAMLADALARVLAAAPAAYALLVDAKDDGAVAFYRHHGFITLESSPRTLFLPIAVAAGLGSLAEYNGVYVRRNQFKNARGNSRKRKNSQAESPAPQTNIKQSA